MARRPVRPYADFLIGDTKQLHTILRSALLSAQPILRPLRSGQLASAEQPDHQRRPALGCDRALVGEIQSAPNLGSGSAIHALSGSAAGACSLPGDPGIPKTIAPTSYQNFAPRIGLAYSPQLRSGIPENRSLEPADKAVFEPAMDFSTLRFPGLSAGIMYSVPPFGFNYLSPGPPLLATPFITAATGFNNGQRFPFPFPPHNVSRRTRILRSTGPTLCPSLPTRSSITGTVCPISTTTCSPSSGKSPAVLC